MNIRFTIIFVLAFFYVEVSFAQELPEYDMSDTTLTDCKGILYDDGGENGLYSNFANITTTIQTGGSIVLTFSGEFVIEPTLDQLLIYDGPDASSPLLGIFDGQDLPPVLTANSGYVTLVFLSDQSAAYAGWTMEWETIVPPPIPPSIQVLPTPICFSESIQVNFNYALYCDWLNSASFELNYSDLNINVLSIDWNCVNDSVDFLQLTLGEAIDVNCSYQLTMDITIPDICGTPYFFTATDDFEVTGCPIDGVVEIAQDTICPGACTTIEFISTGCNSYNIVWNNGAFFGAGPHEVCIDTTTVFTAQVTDVTTGQGAVFSSTINTLSSVILSEDLSICQSIDAFEIPAGTTGWWEGAGIENQETGLFEPDSALAGINIIYFEALGCMDSIEIYVEAISTENFDAACPGADPFQLVAFPLGGLWNGEFTSSGGVFSPEQAGSFVVYYSVNGCTDSVNVNVDTISGDFVLDTLCQSVWTDTLLFSPLGGYWEGDGLLDSLYGVFAPEQMVAGNFEFIYHIYGCEQSFTGHILPVYAGDRNHTVCPLEEPQVFYDELPVPENGVWSGEGIVNEITGLFDPSIPEDGSYVELLYTVDNGCSDTMYVYVKLTEIGLDSLFLCVGDDEVILNEESVSNDPSWGGEWLGNNLTFENDEWILNVPSNESVFQLTYLRNTCTDSMVVVVYSPEIMILPDTLCSNEEPITLSSAVVPGQYWQGNGITEQTLGVFDPAVSGPGTHELVRLNRAGCSDTIQVVVEEFIQAEISGIDPTYCFEDENHLVSFIPEGGEISGNFTDTILNSSLIGAGVYEVIYTSPSEVCPSSDTVSFSVYPELETVLNVSDSTLCDGQASTIAVTANGGNPSFPVTYQWSNGAFPINVQTIAPASSILISVTTSDGCSDDAIDSVFLEVLPRIEYGINTSDTLCFGDIGFANAVPLNSNGEFQLFWNGLEQSSISAEAGSALEFQIIDISSGCEQDTTILLPSYPPILANFSLNPNVDCIPFDDREEIQIIDFSQGATSGEWNLGNGVTVEYQVGSAPLMSFASAGESVISLIVFNNGGCSDTAFSSVCILPADPLYIPDIFSPNGDGNNDFFRVRGRGIIEFELAIYNRFGQRVFFSRNAEEGWDGTLLGSDLPSGNYVYVANVKMDDGTNRDMKGEIVLIR